MTARNNYMLEFIIIYHRWHFFFPLVSVERFDRGRRGAWLSASGCEKLKKKKDPKLENITKSRIVQTAMDMLTEIM